MKNNLYKSRTYNRINNKINKLGSDYNPLIFLNLRMVFSLLIILLFVLFIENGYIFGPLCGLLFYYSIEYFIFDLWIQYRVYKIEYDSIEYLELLLVSLRSGKDLISSIESISSLKNNLLTKEFNRVVNNVKYGVSVSNAISDIRKYIPSDILSGIVKNISDLSNDGILLIESLERNVSVLREKNNNIKREIIKLVPFRLNILSFFYLLFLIGAVFKVLVDLKIIKS